MKIRMLLAAARLLAVAHPGCTASAEGGSARVEPGAVTVVETRAARTHARASEIEVSRSAATATQAAPIAAQAVSDDALIKPLDNPYQVDGAPPAGPLPMFGAILLQRTTDVEAWKAAFEESRAQRQQAGFVAQGVMRGIDDPQLVAVWLAVTDVDRAKRYFADKSIRARLRAAGGLGQPDVQLSSNLAAKMEPGRSGLSAAILRLRLADAAAFKAAFAREDEARDAAGIVGYSLGQDVDNEHVVYAYLQSEDPELLKAYVGSKQTKQSWREAGLRGRPQLFLVKEGELTLCR